MANSPELKPGLWTDSQMPRNSTVLRLRNQSEMKKSPSFSFSMPVSEMKSSSLAVRTVMAVPWTSMVDFLCLLMALLRLQAIWPRCVAKLHRRSDIRPIGQRAVAQLQRSSPWWRAKSVCSFQWVCSCDKPQIEFVQNEVQVIPKKLMRLAKTAPLHERSIIEVPGVNAGGGGDVVANQVEP